MIFYKQWLPKIVTAFVVFFACALSQSETTDNEEESAPSMSQEVIEEICAMDPDQVRRKREQESQQQVDPKEMADSEVEGNDGIDDHRQAERDFVKKHKDEVSPTTGDKNFDFTPEKDSPFSYACQDGATRKGRGKTGLFRNQIPKTDFRGTQATDFFKGVIDQAVSYGQENVNLAKNIQYCLGKGRSHPDCGAMNTWANNDFPKKVNEARFHLSLTEKPLKYHMGINAGISVGTEPNTQLGVPWDSYKEKSWQPLTTNEKQRAKTILKKYKSTMAQTCGWDPKRLNYGKNKVVARELQGVRARHFMQYNAIVSEYPIIQYIHSPSPGVSEISEAAKKLQDNAQNEINHLMNLRQQLSQLKPQDPIPWEALQLFDYQGMVEGFLMANPQFCGVAASAVYTDRNYDNRRLLYTAPILVASFSGLPIVIAGTAAASGAISWSYFSEARSDFKASKQRQMSQVFNEAQLSGAEDLAMKSREVYNQGMMLPMELVGLGIGSRVAKAYGMTKSGARASRAAIFQLPRKFRSLHSVKQFKQLYSKKLVGNQ